ncbi:MAG: ABC transporter permease subunit [Myxococcales bacterium]|nr:ABC transporter permease subunit [Myxococcales bacterium]
MSGFDGLLRKELTQLFATPIALVSAAVFWAVAGYFFSFGVFYVRANHMIGSFHNMSILLLLMAPLITMRTFAEERRSGTLELLLTLPLGEARIVLAKFLAAELLLLVMVAGTATAVLPLYVFGRPDLGPILGGYLGVLGLGTCFVSIGIAASSATDNQVVAAVSAWGISLLLWFVDYVSGLGIEGSLPVVARYLSLSLHYVDLVRGVLPVETLVYLASLTALSLVIATQVLRVRRP